MICPRDSGASGSPPVRDWRGTDRRAERARADAKKRLVNDACADAGLPPRYTDVGFTNSPVLSMGTVTRDRFYGRPLATAIKEYLQMRGSSDRGGRGAASVNEIHAALVEG